MNKNSIPSGLIGIIIVAVLVVFYIVLLSGTRVDQTALDQATKGKKVETVSPTLLTDSDVKKILTNGELKAQLPINLGQQSAKDNPFNNLE